MTIAAYNSTSKGYVPSMSAEAKASLEKGRQEREAKAVSQTGTTQPATATKATSAAQNAGTAGKPAAPSAAPSSTVVNISNAAKAKLEAEKTGATGTANAAAAAGDPNGKPKAVKFNSIDDAIAYGTRKANEQAAARQGLQGRPAAETGAAAAKVETSQAGSTKKGYTPELSTDAKASLEKGRQERAAAAAAEAEKASASQKASASKTAGATSIAA